LEQVEECEGLKRDVNLTKKANKAYRERTSGYNKFSGKSASSSTQDVKQWFPTCSGLGPSQDDFQAAGFIIQSHMFTTLSDKNIAWKRQRLRNTDAFRKRTEIPHNEDVVYKKHATNEKTPVNSRFFMLIAAFVNANKWKVRRHPLQPFRESQVGNHTCKTIELLCYVYFISDFSETLPLFLEESLLTGMEVPYCSTECLGGWPSGGFTYFSIRYSRKIMFS